MSSVELSCGCIVAAMLDAFFVFELENQDKYRLRC